MGNWLEGVIDSAPAQEPRILVYGCGGIGKSTFAAGAPSPIVIDCDNGLGYIKVPRKRCRTLDDVTAGLDALARHQHEYATVVVDCIDTVCAFATNYLLDSSGVDSLAEYKGGFGKGNSALHALMQGVLESLSRISDLGIGVLLTCHAEAVEVAEPGVATYQQFAPSLPRTIRESVVNWCDHVFFATRETVKVEEKSEGFGRKRGVALRADKEHDRVLYAVQTPAWVAKNRGHLPAKMPLDYDAFRITYDSCVFGDQE